MGRKKAKKKKVKKQLSIKRQMFVNGLLAGKSMAAAYRDAGYKDDRRNAQHLTTNNDIQDTIQEALKNHNITRDRSCQKISEGYDAVKQVPCDIIVRQENGKLKVNKNSNDWIEVPDQTARHKWVIVGLELLGDIKQRANGNGNTIITVIYGHREEPKGDNSSLRDRRGWQSLLTQPNPKENIGVG